MSATCLVLAAGESRRLGRPKQLLPFRGGTLLDATLDLVRRARAEGLVEQVLVTLGGAADEIERVVRLGDVEVVRPASYTAGCSSSIVAALPLVDASAEGIVLMLGDQPLVPLGAVRSLASTARRERLAVCAYTDGLGHPFWLGRELFGELGELHGDKAVWKLVDAAGDDLVTVPVPGPVPRDVDTWADYEALIAVPDPGETG